MICILDLRPPSRGSWRLGYSAVAQMGVSSLAFRHSKQRRAPIELGAWAKPSQATQTPHEGPGALWQHWLFGFNQLVSSDFSRYGARRTYGKKKQTLQAQDAVGSGCLRTELSWGQAKAAVPFRARCLSHNELRWTPCPTNTVQRRVPHFNSPVVSDTARKIFAVFNRATLQHARANQRQVFT